MEGQPSNTENPANTMVQVTVVRDSDTDKVKPKSEFDVFHAFAQKIVAVPKSEIDEQRDKV